MTDIRMAGIADCGELRRVEAFEDPGGEASRWRNRDLWRAVPLAVLVAVAMVKVPQLLQPLEQQTEGEAVAALWAVGRVVLVRLVALV